ncbi:MAG: HEAT repeat domain-containing protein, partial [Planctomycetota bacterium]
EGVAGGGGQQKAMALWKWFRVLMSATGGSYAYEGPLRGEGLVWDPHKIFACYGHHQCDGLSWAMVGLWRSVGYVGFDECTHGHTTAALRYRDDDGVLRYHSFDPQARYYYWYSKLKRVGTRSMPAMRGMVYRHITAPRLLHSTRTSLRVGEVRDRRWDNTGHVIPHTKDKWKAEKTKYYAYRPGRTDGVYAAVGEEVQTLEALTDPAGYTRQLWTGSRGTACSAPEKGKATLHPAKAGETAEFVYRLTPPFPVADAKVECRLLATGRDDVCRLWLSRDGKQWKRIYYKAKPGEEPISLNIGRGARLARRPDVYTDYEFFVKAEFRTDGDVRGVGMTGLTVTAWRQLSKRALPNLRPGENWLRVDAAKLEADLALELDLRWSVKGKPFVQTRRITEFPHYFRVDVADAEERVLGNYDKNFNDGDVRMERLRFRLVPAPAEASPSLPEADGKAAFAASCPHPAKMVNPRTDRRPEPKDEREVNGFLPQGDCAGTVDEAAMKKLIAHLPGNREKDWRAVEDLGDYPGAVDALLAALPKANIDQTLFICKALARIRPRKAVGPLLAKWKLVPGGTPGTRYIPDTLAAIGDRSVVPHLVAPLKKCRFGHRLHVARALGILGGDEAEKALEDLAANDPFLGVREEAKRALAKLRAAK